AGPVPHAGSRGGERPGGFGPHRDQGHGAIAVQLATGLQLRPPLRSCTRPLPHRGTAARRASVRSFHRLLERAMTAAPLLEVEGLKKHFPIHKGVFSKVSGYVHAVDGVSFRIGRGETLGLVGESGCGKSTVGRTLLKLLEPTDGTIRMAGEDITRLAGERLLPYRRRMQMIYQDPYASLNPRMTAGEIVGEPLIVHQIGTQEER